MAKKNNSNNVGFIRYNEDEDFQLGELTVGDFVYGDMADVDGKPKGREVCIVSDISKITAEVYTARYRQMKWMGRAITQEMIISNYCTQPISNLTIVPFSEDWFAENSAIFRKLLDGETMEPRDSDLKVAFAYEFKARRWQATYYAVGFELTYQDHDLEDKLHEEGLSWVASKTESRRKATLVQIVKPVKPVKQTDGRGIYKTSAAAAVAQFIAVHELQHFLRLCGIFDAMNVPKRSIDDANEMAESFGRK